MSTWFTVLFVLQLVVTFVIFLVLMNRKMKVPGGASSGGAEITPLSMFRELAAFSKEHHERIGDYVRANWSGIPNQLPGVLKSLLDQLESDVRARGITVDREMLKTLIATSLRYHKIGKANDVGEALEQVA